MQGKTETARTSIRATDYSGFARKIISAQKQF